MFIHCLVSSGMCGRSSSNAITLCEECDDEERTAALHFCLTCARPLCEYVALPVVELSVLISDICVDLALSHCQHCSLNCRPHALPRAFELSLALHTFELGHVYLFVCVSFSSATYMWVQTHRFHRQNHQKSKQTKLHPLVALSSVTPELMHRGAGHPLSLIGGTGADPNDPGTPTYPLTHSLAHVQCPTSPDHHHRWLLAGVSHAFIHNKFQRQRTCARVYSV
jgi:hypothetical protein